jgi:hypothetical protein
MPNPLPGTIANIAGTCVGTVVGAITQEALAPKTAHDLQRWMRKEATKVEVATKAVLGTYSNTGLKTGRLMDTPVTNLIYELLTRQQGDQKKGINKFVNDDYDNISKVVVCDPNNNYFIRNLVEHEREEKQKENAALAGVATGTAASAAVTTGVSELQSGISNADMKKKAADYSLSTGLPGVAAAGLTFLGSFVGDKRAKNKTARFEKNVKPRTIDTNADAERYESDLSENLRMMQKPSEQVLITANILLQTSPRYSVFIGRAIANKYKVDFAKLIKLKDELSAHHIEIDDEIKHQQPIFQAAKTKLRDVGVELTKKAHTLTLIGRLTAAKEKLDEAEEKLKGFKEQMVQIENKQQKNSDQIKTLKEAETQEIKTTNKIHAEQILQLIDKLNRVGVKSKSSYEDKNRLGGGSKTRKRRRTRKMRKHKSTFSKRR